MKKTIFLTYLILMSFQLWSQNHCLNLDKKINKTLFANIKSSKSVTGKKHIKILLDSIVKAKNDTFFIWMINPIFGDIALSYTYVDKDTMLRMNWYKKDSINYNDELESPEFPIIDCIKNWQKNAFLQFKGRLDAPYNIAIRVIKKRKKKFVIDKVEW